MSQNGDNDEQGNHDEQRDELLYDDAAAPPPVAGIPHMYPWMFPGWPAWGVPPPPAPVPAPVPASIHAPAPIPAVLPSETGPNQQMRSAASLLVDDESFKNALVQAMRAALLPNGGLSGAAAASQGLTAAASAPRQQDAQPTPSAQLGEQAAAATAPRPVQDAPPDSTGVAGPSSESTSNVLAELKAAVVSMCNEVRQATTRAEESARDVLRMRANMVNRAGTSSQSFDVEEDDEEEEDDEGLNLPMSGPRPTPVHPSRALFGANKKVPPFKRKPGRPSNRQKALEAALLKRQQRSAAVASTSRSQRASTSRDVACVVCMEEVPNCTLDNCTHMFCETCVIKIIGSGEQKCPVCRKEFIEYQVRHF